MTPRGLAPLPTPADFAAPPNAATIARWAEADRAADQPCLERLRERLAAERIDAYFGVRSEHMRYLTGFRLDPGEDKVAGHSGQFLVSGAEAVVLADSRYTIQAPPGRRPGGRVEPTTYDLAAAWGPLLASLGARRVAVEAGFVSHACGRACCRRTDGRAGPGRGLGRGDRAMKEPAEIERIAAAAAVADAHSMRSCRRSGRASLSASSRGSSSC